MLCDRISMMNCVLMLGCYLVVIRVFGIKCILNWKVFELIYFMECMFLSV